MVWQTFFSWPDPTNIGWFLMLSKLSISVEARLLLAVLLALAATTLLVEAKSKFHNQKI